MDIIKFDKKKNAAIFNIYGEKNKYFFMILLLKNFTQKDVLFLYLYEYIKCYILI